MKSKMPLSQESLIFMAKLCEQLESFDDIIKYIKQYIQYGDDLSEEEISLLSYAYKNQIASRRKSWEKLRKIEQKEESKVHIHLIENFKSKVKQEIETICNEVIDLIDNSILNNCSSLKSKVFFLTMKGEYNQYLADCSTGEAKIQICQKALGAYSEATDIINNNNFSKTSPVRLQLALRLSVFHHETNNDPDKAFEIAKIAFIEARDNIMEIAEEDYRDSICILSILRDNLGFWNPDFDFSSN